MIFFFFIIDRNILKERQIYLLWLSANFTNYMFLLMYFSLFETNKMENLYCNPITLSLYLISIPFFLLILWKRFWELNLKNEYQVHPKCYLHFQIYRKDKEREMNRQQQKEAEDKRRRVREAQLRRYLSEKTNSDDVPRVRDSIAERLKKKRYSEYRMF